MVSAEQVRTQLVSLIWAFSSSSAGFVHACRLSCCQKSDDTVSQIKKPLIRQIRLHLQFCIQGCIVTRYVVMLRTSKFTVDNHEYGTSVIFPSKVQRFSAEFTKDCLTKSIQGHFNHVKATCGFSTTVYVNILFAILEFSHAFQHWSKIQNQETLSDLYLNSWVPYQLSFSMDA